jgi:D-aminopeptidase
MEGCAGVLNFEDWTRPSGRYYEKGKRLLTRETNAAVAGLADGGVEHIRVVDGHGAGGIDPEELDPRAELLRGAPKPPWPWTLDESFDGIGFIGQHAMAGTPFSHLTHTQSCRYVELAINDIPIGEYGQLALCAMELGVPAILACGEKALCEEARRLTPGVVTSSVKEGLLEDGLEELDMAAYRRSKLSAIHLSPDRARGKIQSAARRAAQTLRDEPETFEHPELNPPYIRTVRLRATEHQPRTQYRDEHPASIIELMNAPMGSTEK